MTLARERIKTNMLFREDVNTYFALHVTKNDLAKWVLHEGFELRL